MEEHGVEPSHYLEYVHRVPVDEVLRPNGRLRRTLESIESPKSIFTNGSRQHSLVVLKALGVEDLFGEIFDITSGRYIPKPDPRAYRAVVDTLGAEPGKSVLVEDLPQNLPPAKDLGMTTILIGAGERPAAADYMISGLEQLPRILPGLAG
jgi:putative hydrolase of the HAD superfamily